MLGQCRAGDLRRFPTVMDIHTDTRLSDACPLVRQRRIMSDTIRLHHLW